VDSNQRRQEIHRLIDNLMKSFSGVFKDIIPQDEGERQVAVILKLIAEELDSERVDMDSSNLQITEPIEGKLEFRPPQRIFPMLIHFPDDGNEIGGPIVGAPNRLEIAATTEGNKLVLMNWKGEKVAIEFK